MAHAYHSLGHIFLMLILLVCSAFFSGSETALFNLSRQEINLFKRSKHKLYNLTATLLKNPGKLLGCLLFGNMLVNILFFAIASIVTIRIEKQIGATAAAVTAVITFALLLMFGEILPKSLAYLNTKSISTAVAIPVFICSQLLGPFVFVFRLLIAEPAIRLILGPGKSAKPITTDEFESLIQQIRKQGHITAEENKLLTEIVELGFLKVRHVCRPRVDMVACDIKNSNQAARKIMHENHITSLAVYTEKIDNIVGMVSLRRLLLAPDTALPQLVEKAQFVPEQKKLESLLQFFRTTGTDSAIVVDEYGGIAGQICLEDIAEQLFGPIPASGDVEPIVQLGPFKYRIAGDLAIHDWAKTFDISPMQNRFSTVAGLVTCLLGKAPKANETASLKNLRFTVERVEKHRIQSLILTLEPIQSNDK